MSCFILLKGNSAKGEDVPWLDGSMAGSIGDGNERSGTPQSPGNGGRLCCQSQLSESDPSQSESDPSQAPWHGLRNNFPADFPFPSRSQEHPEEPRGGMPSVPGRGWGLPQPRM